MVVPIGTKELETNSPRLAQGVISPQTFSGYDVTCMWSFS